MSALASAGAALAACQAAPSTPGKPPALPDQPNSGVNVVVMIYRQEFSEDDMQRFMQENPGISLEFVDLATSAGFSAMAAAGTPPDLVRVEAPSVPQMLARQLLLDLTPYFETSKILKTDDLMPVNDYYKAESPLRVGSGSIYGMCKDFSPDLTIFINKAIFDKNNLPVDDTQSWTYAEIMDIAMKVLEKEGDRITTHGFGWEGNWIDRFWMNSLAETGLSLYSEGYDKLNLAGSEEAVRIARWYFDMQKDLLTFSAINPSPNGGIGADFSAGQLAMCQYGFWFSAMAEGETTRGKVMMMPAPHWAGQRRDVAISATGVVIPSATKVA
ncbi:MAG TPA: extracellular solute-binding protein, partial [Anaerolinea sp.]|nr:extracellular solute-binding protein [Anaerolinea sp.]